MSSTSIISETLKQRGHSYVTTIPEIPGIKFSPLLVTADLENHLGTHLQLGIVFVMPRLASPNQIKHIELHNVVQSVHSQQGSILELMKPELEESLHVSVDNLKDFKIKTQLAYLDTDGRVLLVDATPSFPCDLKHR